MVGPCAGPRSLATSWCSVRRLLAKRVFLSPTATAAQRPGRCGDSSAKSESRRMGLVLLLTQCCLKVLLSFMMWLPLRLVALYL